MTHFVTESDAEVKNTFNDATRELDKIKPPNERMNSSSGSFGDTLVNGIKSALPTKES